MTYGQCCNCNKELNKFDMPILHVEIEGVDGVLCRLCQ